MGATGSNAGNEVRLERPINLAGGVALVIGGVIGMGIYALIAAVGAYAGSTLWLAFILAITVSVVGRAPHPAVSAMPRAGVPTWVINPATGTVTSYRHPRRVQLPAMVAYGLQSYIAPTFRGAPVHCCSHRTSSFPGPLLRAEAHGCRSS